MDTNRIASAIRDIEKCKPALAWLEQYGDGLTEADKECASVSVKLNYASACNGAKDAEAMLSRYASLMIRDIVRASIENCRNTIDISEQTIRSEATKGATGGTRR